MAGRIASALTFQTDTNAPADLPTVIVTATRAFEDPFRLPYPVDADGPLELEHKMPRTTQRIPVGGTPG